MELRCSIKHTSHFAGFVRMENWVVRLVQLTRTLIFYTIFFVDFIDKAFIKVIRYRLGVTISQLQVFIEMALKRLYLHESGKQLFGKLIFLSAHSIAT